MDDVKSKTLIELIDFIQSLAKEVNIDFANKNLYNHHVEELAFRLSLNRTSTIIFSFVFFHSLRGIYSTKREVVADVFSLPTTDIFLAIQELIKNNLIKSYRFHSRRPEVSFYTTEEIDKMIINDIVPTVKESNRNSTEKLILKPFENGEDYWILINDEKIGVAYHLLSDYGSYTVMVGEYLILHYHSFDEMKEKLTTLHKEKKLKL
jgi:hypothetical protein